MGERDFSRLVKALAKLGFQPLKGGAPTTPGVEGYRRIRDLNFSDVELVEKAQSLWDAAIKSGDIIPAEIEFPIVTLDGVELNWNEDKTKVVFSKGGAIVYDDLQDATLPRPVDYNEDRAFLLSNGEYFLLTGSPYDDEIFIFDL